MNIDHKYQTFATEPGSTHNLVVDLVPPKSRVLEFGCATGYMSEVLASRLGCSVVGIELSPAAAELARDKCEKVIVGDAESLDFREALGEDSFDVILFADVLEHLRDPARALKRVRPLLAEGGTIVASIPNVAHGSVRLALLRGEFRYRELGLLDRTHLRFFTRESIQDMFEETGYLITHWVRQRLPVDQTEIAVPRETVLGAARSLIDADVEATTYQFVIRATPTSEGALVQALSQARATLAQNEESIAELHGRLMAAESRAALLDADVRSLTVRISEQALALRESNARVAAITTSRSWHVARLLSAARQFVVPEDARGRRA